MLVYLYLKIPYSISLVVMQQIDPKTMLNQFVRIQLINLLKTIQKNKQTTFLYQTKFSRTKDNNLKIHNRVLYLVMPQLCNFFSVTITSPSLHSCPLSNTVFNYIQQDSLYKTKSFSFSYISHFKS